MKKMNRRDFLRDTALGIGASHVTLSGLSLGADEANGGDSAARSNVLFIYVDDLNDWISPLGGYPGVHTPNLDRLAKRSVSFSRAYRNVPASSPSRAATFFGVSAHHSGIYLNPRENNRGDWRQSELLNHLDSLPKVFKDRGTRPSVAEKSSTPITSEPSPRSV